MTLAAGLGLTAGLGTAALPTSQRHATLNLKLFDTSPDLLPPNLRHHFDIMLQQNATFMEASMRAGELTTALCETPAVCVQETGTSRQGAQHVQWGPTSWLSAACQDHPGPSQL